MPEALDLVKKAELDKEYPVDTPDNCMASALSIEYAKHISGKSVDYDTIEKVAQSVEAFGLGEKVRDLSHKMVRRNTAALFKSASSETTETFLEKQAHWMGEQSGFKDIAKLVKQAEELKVIADRIGEDVDDKVKVYLCEGYMSKSAAVEALSTRYHLTNNEVFSKLASAVTRESEMIPGNKTIKSLCETVTKFDKQAGLDLKGFDFYRETILTKSAAVNSTMAYVCGANVPISKVMSIPSNYLDSYIGPDFAKELASDPASAKAMIESLPADVQKVLAELIKNV